MINRPSANKAPLHLEQTLVNSLLVSVLVNLGDVVMMTSALNLIKKNRPELRLAALARPESADILQGHPALDQVIIYPYRSGSPFKGLGRLVKTVKAGKFDGFLSLDRRPRGAAAAFLAGISIRLGPERLFEGSRPELWTRLLLTKILPMSPEDCQGELLEMFQKVARRALGVSGSARPSLAPIKPGLAARAQELLSRLPGPEPGPVIGLCVRTNNRAKNWPPEYFAALLGRLKQELGARLYLTGTAADRAYVEDLLAGIPQTAALNLAGKTGLAELIALAGASDLFITLDNGTAHLMAASQVKNLICILEGTPRDKVTRSLAGARILGPARPHVQVAEVFQAAVEQLNQGQLPS